MNREVFDMGEIDTAWCPGCGNFSILNILKQTFAELEIEPKNLVVVSGISQAAKTPHYFRANVFNGLHGRSLPVATAIRTVNPSLTVIVDSGDGCNYGEDGNHLIHAIRRNPDITMITHNNMVYGLTKGQASPTSQVGFTTPVQVEGVFLEPFNPVAVAVALDASFVARTFCADKDRSKEILKRAIKHKGFALVDMFQPCVTFNRVNTFKWFREHTYYLYGDYDPTNRLQAFGKAVEKDNFPLGVIYLNTNKRTFEENLPAYKKEKTPLFKRELHLKKLEKIIQSKR